MGFWFGSDGLKKHQNAVKNFVKVHKSNATNMNAKTIINAERRKLNHYMGMVKKLKKKLVQNGRKRIYQTPRNFRIAVDPSRKNGTLAPLKELRESVVKIDGYLEIIKNRNNKVNITNNKRVNKSIISSLYGNCNKCDNLYVRLLLPNFESYRSALLSASSHWKNGSGINVKN